MRILLIDDDEQLMEVLAESLIQQHYAVDIATDGEMGWEFITLFNYDLVVLDWMLPKIDGLTLCQQLRTEHYTMPIMLLTARDCDRDKVKGLDAGADDYVVKPFNFDELTARIRALLRREIKVSSPILEWSGLSLDPKTHEVKYQEQLLPLTPKEYSLLELFLRHPQQVFSPGAIIDNLWAGEDPPGEEAVRTHIKGLRQKLSQVNIPKDSIKTVYGIGYRLKNPNPQKPTLESEKIHHSDYAQRIAHAWSTFKNATLERLTLLENLNTDIAENITNSALYEQAQSFAHKLAGSLGIFGFTEGSKIAKQIENLLAKDINNQTELQQLHLLIEHLSQTMQEGLFADSLKSKAGKHISLLIIDRDIAFTAQLAIEAQKSAMETIIAHNINQAKQIIDENSSDVVLIKIYFSQPETVEFIAELHYQKPSIPIITIMEAGKFENRLELVRQGANLVLQQPITPQETIASVTELVKDLGTETKIMILDDDQQVLISLELGLYPWGFQLTTLNNPQQFWNVLETINPDFLVLDVEMPEINGIELCQVLRSDPRWQHLPVLFLTAHQDEKTQHQAFAIGADDYISKPIVASELANRILNRLHRSRIN